MTKTNYRSLSPHQARVALSLERGSTLGNKWLYWVKRFPQGDLVLNNMLKAGLIVVEEGMLVREEEGWQGTIALTEAGHSRLREHKDAARMAQRFRGYRK